MSKKQTRIPAPYLPVFCREMCQLTHSGVPAAEGLSLLREDETDPSVLSWLDELCEYTDNGMSLSAALRASGAFPPYMTEMLFLAERTGRLEDTLAALQFHYEKEARIRSDIISTVSVPAVLLLVMIAVVLLMITRVLPVFDRTFAQLGVRMGMVASGMMRVGNTLAKAGTAAAVVIAVLVVAAHVVAFVPSLRVSFTAWFRRNFGGHGLWKKLAVSRFASAMAMGTASGLNLEESVEAAAKICGGAKQIDEMAERCRTQIAAGASPADALAASGLFSGRDCRLLKISEHTGNLAQTLDEMARRQDEESMRRIERIVGAIEPAVVILTSVLAGMILLSVMLPLMGLLNAV